MEHTFAFIAALDPSGRQFLKVAAETLEWDAEALAVVITPKNEHFAAAIKMGFEDLCYTPLPWPWRLATPAE